MGLIDMTRKGSLTFRGADERKKEYLLAMENKDRPQWTPEKLEEMRKNFNKIVDELVRLDECVINISPVLNIPTYRRLDVMRIVKRAWRLVRQKASRDQYVMEVKFYPAKYGFSLDVINRILEACGLPKIT